MTLSRYNEILEWLQATVRHTRWEGHVYAVGGCCRDRVLGAEIKDVDLAVDLPGGGVDFANWLHSKGLLKEKPVLFLKFGTARVVTKAFPDDELELVQTRKEKYTKETSRCPEVVAGTIEDDCFRRDFTVNTLYHDISRGTDLDLTGHGVEDIRKGILRTPLDPDTTFDDDPVRILRCLRFASRFGWDIDPATFAALCRNIPRLAIVSKERFHTEISKMLTGSDPYDAVTRMDHAGALRYANPLIAEYIDFGGPGGKLPYLWQSQVEMLRNLKYLPKDRRILSVALATLFSALGKMRTRVKDRRGEIRFPNHEMIGSNQLRRMLRSMKFEPEVSADASFLVANQYACRDWGKDAEEMTDKSLRQLQRTCGYPQRLALLLDYLLVRNPECEGCLHRVAERSAELETEGTAGFDKKQPQPEKQASGRVSGRRRRRGNQRHRPRHRSNMKPQQK